MIPVPVVVRRAVGADRAVAAVERHFNLAKKWRGLATRNDKLVITYRAAYILCVCIAWTRV